ncbi:hypothetical protein BH09VER1_BH09VER1_16440 [soil metagenome]
MKKPGDFTLRLIALFSGIAIASAVAVLLLVDHSRRTLESYRSSLEERGEKLNIEDLRPPPPVREGNGARALLDTAREINNLAKEKALRRITWGQGMTRTPGYAEIFHQRPTAQVLAENGSKATVEEIPWAAAQANHAAVDPLLEKTRKIAQSPLLEFHPDYGAGLAAPTSGIAQLIGVSQLLTQQTILLLHDGKVSSAVDNVSTLFRIAEMTSKQQALISQLLSLSMIRMASISTWEILHSKEATQAEVVRLQGLWEDIKPFTALKATLRMERATALPMFDRADDASKFVSGSSPSSFSINDLEPALETGTWATLYRYDDERELIVDFQALLDHLPGPDGNWRPFLQEADSIKKRLEDAGLSRMFSHSLSYSAMAAMGRFASTDAVRQLCITAIAIRRYQLDHENALPPSLSALVPTYLAKVPLDPMDGKPLHYQPDGAGDYLLYSVGKDGVDDGGNAGGAGGKITPDFVERIDIVWPRAEKP